jgi:hypothetical protein
MGNRGRLTVAAFVISLSLGTECGSQAGEKPGALPAWVPDKALLTKLAPYTTVAGYQVRPPKGYDAIEPPPAPPGGKYFGWAGARRADKSSPSLTVAVATPPPEVATKATLEQFLDSMLNGVKIRRTNWKQTAVERGQVNGRTFLRARWSGTIKDWKMHGFMYVTRDGDTFIAVSSQDVEPHHTEALKLAEAAALTFKKK